jgi:hypothetical protein
MSLGSLDFRVILQTVVYLKKYWQSNLRKYFDFRPICLLTSGVLPYEKWVNNQKHSNSQSEHGYLEILVI